MKKRLLLVLLFHSLLMFTLGAIYHEADMSENFKKTGDAGSFIWDIKDSSLSK